MPRGLKILFSSLSILLSSICYAQNLEILSESMFHGAYYSVATTGDYAIFSGHGHLLSVSFENPANPEVVAIRQFDGGTITAFQQENYIYFVGDASGSGSDVEIADVSNPENPTIISSFNTRSIAYDIIVDGNYAYVADYTGQILIANVADPANPYAESRINTPHEAHALGLAGNYLYVAEYDSGLVIIDVSDPAHPSIAGRANPDSAGYHAFVDMDLSGNHVYVADNSGGLRIFDISNPTVPVCVSTFRPDNNGINKVAVDHNIAYCSSSWRELYVVDISDPLAPDSIGHFGNENENPRNFAISDSRLFLLGNEYHGYYGYVNMLDISEPSQPTLISAHHGCPVAPAYVALSGNYAFVGSNGIYTIDITNPANPEKVSEISVPISQLSIVDNIAYAITDSSRLILLNVSNPESLITLGLCTIPGHPNNLAVSNNYVYASSSGSGFYIISTSDPHSPEVIQHFDDGSQIGRMVCEDHYLYSSSGNFIIFDISEPENPIRVGNYTLPYNSNSIFVVGDYAYTTATYQSWVDMVMIVDISDKANPVLASMLETPNTPDAVYVEGHYAYIVESGSRIEVADISDPYYPSLITSHDISSLSSGIVVRDNLLYLATYLSFMIMQLQGVDDIEDEPPSGDRSLEFECFPNPSNSSITLKYNLASPANVILTIYDLQGRLINTVFKNYQHSGQHKITWNASNLASGIYFAELNAGPFVIRSKFTLLK